MEHNAESDAGPDRLRELVESGMTYAEAVAAEASAEHGTLTAYTKRDCRCDICREFWNRYMRWWRADQRGRLHGHCPTCTCPLPEKPTSVTSPVAPAGGEGK